MAGEKILTRFLQSGEIGELSLRAEISSFASLSLARQREKIFTRSKSREIIERSTSFGHTGRGRRKESLFVRIERRGVQPQRTRRKSFAPTSVNNLSNTAMHRSKID